MTNSESDKKPESSNELVVQGGFRSPAEKRKFQAIIYAMAVVVALAPLAVSYALVMRNPWIAPGGMELDIQERGQTLEILDVKRWQGETWFLNQVSNEQGVSDYGLFKQNGDEFQFVSHLDGDSRSIFFVMPDDEIFLLPDVDALWVITTDEVYRYKNSVLEPEPIPIPFSKSVAGYVIYQGHLTAVGLDFGNILSKEGELKDGHLNIWMRQWKDNQWVDQGRIPMAPVFEKQFRSVVKSLGGLEKDFTEGFAQFGYEDLFDAVRTQFTPMLKVSVSEGELSLLWALNTEFNPKDEIEYPVLDSEFDSILMHTGWPANDLTSKVKKQLLADSNETGSANNGEVRNDSANWIKVDGYKSELLFDFQLLGDSKELRTMGWTYNEEDRPNTFVGRIVDGKFEQLFEFPDAAYAASYHVVKGDGDSDYRLYCGGDPRTLWYIEANQDGVSRKTTFGSSFSELYYPATWSYWKLRLLVCAITAFSMLVFALLVKRLNQVYRDTTYVAGGLLAKPAALWKRSIAKGIDTLLFLFPFFVLGYCISNDSIVNKYDMMGAFYDTVADLHMFGWYSDFDRFLILAFLGIVFVCPLFVAFLLSLSEAFSGKTLGKWLLGIEVRDVSLARTSFRPVLLRRLLMAVDGYAIYFIFAPAMYFSLRNSLFYSTFAGAFVVGMVLIAVSEKQQRVGDMVAKTVVIQSGSIVSSD